MVNDYNTLIKEKEGLTTELDKINRIKQEKE